MKKIAVTLLILAMALVVGCQKPSAEPVKQTYLDLFDTVTAVTVYGADGAKVAKIVENSYARLHAVFDAYAPHENVRGLYALNNAAGEWAVVEPELLDLLVLCRELSAVSPLLDVTQGALFDLWRGFRDGERDLPAAAELNAAAAHGGWENVEIDPAQSKVRLRDPGMRIDLGAVAKGYAAGKLGAALEAAGHRSYIIDAGGNVVTGVREKPFIVGVTNPRGDGLVLRLAMVNLSAVSSGDYQRYRMYEGRRYHHIVDVETRYPADQGIAQVTVLTEDSAYADFLSTTLFLMDYGAGRAFSDENGLSVIWIMDDGEIRMTDGAREMAVK